MAEGGRPIGEVASAEEGSGEEADSAAVVSAGEAAGSAAAALRGAGERMRAENFFTAEEKKRIEQAVAAAEQRTSGEIVPMVVGASSRYAEAELAGLVIGLVVGTAGALAFGYRWGIAQMELAWPLMGAVLGLFLCHIPALKGRLVRKRDLAHAVHLRALAAFTAHGLHHTRAHNGILIFISLLERRVEILADRGIHEKVKPGTWDEIVNLITAALKSADACAGLCAAIERCGEILGSHFPRAAADRNELEDKLVTEE